MTGLGDPAGGPERIGTLLARLRRSRGISQLQLAGRLCAASGMPTVGRHEVSRWEREQRLPGRYWRGWLATVLGVPLELLEAAVAAARDQVGPTDPSSETLLWTPLSAPELDTAPTFDLPALAHAWLAGASGPPPQPAGPGQPDPPDPPAEQLADRLATLRRCDDLIGGTDLADRVDGTLRAALRSLSDRRTAGQRPRLLRLVAESGQLAGWVHSDAASDQAARRAYRVALRAAAAAGDRPLAAHIFGSLSHHCLATGDPHQALLLARTGYTGVRTGGPAALRALLLHRIALAAACAGQRREAGHALRLADRTADRAGSGEPPGWLYWLDRAELAAMTGRCLAALGRPARAIGVLTHAHPAASPRAAAIYRGWLARAYLAIGEPEPAQLAAREAYRLATAAGSARALSAAGHLLAYQPPR